MCSHVLDVSGFIPRLVFESKTDIHLLQYASTEKHLLLFVFGWVLLGGFLWGFEEVWFQGFFGLAVYGAFFMFGWGFLLLGYFWGRYIFFLGFPIAFGPGP